MSIPIPPDLRVICRKLASTSSDQLLQSLPSLVNHILRCGQILATSHDTKLKGDRAEGPMLVHKLKTSITTLLNSRTKEERFAAVALVKAMVDAGGWEVLRGSQPWVSGLISIIQVRTTLCSGLYSKHCKTQYDYPYHMTSTNLSLAEKRSPTIQRVGYCDSHQGLPSTASLSNTRQRDCHSDNSSLCHGVSSNSQIPCFTFG